MPLPASNMASPEQINKLRKKIAKEKPKDKKEKNEKKSSDEIKLSFWEKIQRPFAGQDFWEKIADKIEKQENEQAMNQVKEKITGQAQAEVDDFNASTKKLIEKVDSGDGKQQLTQIELEAQSAFARLQEQVQSETDFLNIQEQVNILPNYSVSQLESGGYEVDSPDGQVHSFETIEQLKNYFNQEQLAQLDLPPGYTLSEMITGGFEIWPPPGAGGEAHLFDTLEQVKAFIDQEKNKPATSTPSTTEQPTNDSNQELLQQVENEQKILQDIHEEIDREEMVLDNLIKLGHIENAKIIFDKFKVHIENDYLSDITPFQQKEIIARLKSISESIPQKPDIEPSSFDAKVNEVLLTPEELEQLNHGPSIDPRFPESKPNPDQAPRADLAFSTHQPEFEKNLASGNLNKASKNLKNLKSLLGQMGLTKDELGQAEQKIALLSKKLNQAKESETKNRAEIYQTRFDNLKKDLLEASSDKEKKSVLSQLQEFIDMMELPFDEKKPYYDELAELKKPKTHGKILDQIETEFADLIHAKIETTTESENNAEQLSNLFVKYGFWLTPNPTSPNEYQGLAHIQGIIDNSEDLFRRTASGKRLSTRDQQLLTYFETQDLDKLKRLLKEAKQAGLTEEKLDKAA
ncbi:hypothetical protein A2533_02510 [Candidatus Falkowbacteria bacterium RIFOXYD2_FULL_35_9]|uniref:Uncharacterized protein n=1 Tax=Candidatus Falkowbacteria bacterium RIFOXYC2_FULL_36_12 TaxID=1798002 RepID=A0A1F5T4V9_9BACT|nr:MAG: hypothetical protein A2300_02280 [Candidatus Falkowbacteria bacterium RIFOXYB2_FULL_35_7]OGF33481.1 MAG: hypothetical protein A2478_02200 [Candidatus Falkowbacteria bacterium RIFOXYC2_FULL_36_12]OGF46849.1 MAG: hypothetical protein A2533_02510 [Candidatus Falkowbacteria bacterium RIFOXYD2_FULL_35_9]